MSTALSIVFHSSINLSPFEIALARLARSISALVGIRRTPTVSWRITLVSVSSLRAIDDSLLTRARRIALI